MRATLVENYIPRRHHQTSNWVKFQDQIFRWRLRWLAGLVSGLCFSDPAPPPDNRVLRWMVLGKKANVLQTEA